MRVALLSANACSGDALGNQVAEKAAYFQEHGAHLRVFLAEGRRLHPDVRHVAECVCGPEQVEGCRQFLTSADLVIADYSQYYSLLDLLPLLQDAPARVLLDYHGVTPPELWWSACPAPVQRGQRCRGIVWCADAALVHSAFAETELREHTGFPAGYTYRAGYPLDLGTLSAGQPARDLRKEIGVGSATLLLFVGRLAPNKRPVLLVEALARLRERKPPVHGVLIGSMTDRYALEADRCRQRAQELGVADRLHLLGHVPASRLLDAYRSADVLVMPSVHEGFCLPVLEAFACGLPVVAAAAGALPETVADAGLLFQPDDVNDLVRQIQVHLEEDDGSRAARRERAQQRCAPFARLEWRKQFGRIIEDVLHAPPRPRHMRIAVKPRRSVWSVTTEVPQVRLPLELCNHGTAPALSEGPARWVVRGDVGGESAVAELPEFLLPGRTVNAAINIPVPRVAGTHRVRLRVERFSPTSPDDASGNEVEVELRVRDKRNAELPAEARREQNLQRALAAADQCQHLPEDYLDVTEGWGASWKRWLKRKLLGNFKHAYVDVLARQQSAFNRHVLTVVQELAEQVATLAANPQACRANRDGPDLDGLRTAIQEVRQVLAQMERRLNALQMPLSSPEEIPVESVSQ